ncbi:MAG: DnaJ domain-containing protein, partial [Proteobacteria bacterium]|nr:DnaJ domain-containing protein [Pseudomonadota bacterium]
DLKLLDQDVYPLDAATLRTAPVATEGVLSDEAFLHEQLVGPFARKTATDAEVKTAYRKMVKKYQPDKLRNLGPEHIKGAEDKFRQVQRAYEHIQKERGI